MIILVLFLCVAARAQLYGLSSSVGLVRVFTNGTSLPVGPPVPHELQAQNLAAMDSSHSIYYFVGFDQQVQQAQLVGVSLATGKVTSSVPLPFAEMNFVGVGQYMAFASDLNLVVLSGQTVDQTHLVITVSPTTGAYKKVCEITHLDLDVLGGSASYVPTSQLFVFNLGYEDYIGNFVVSLKTGKFVNVTNTAHGNVESMVFNPKDRLVYGLGLQIEGEAWNRTIVSFDPQTLEFVQRGVVSGFGIESGGISAIDVASQTLYWIGMKAPYVPK